MDRVMDVYVGLDLVDADATFLLRKEELMVKAEGGERVGSSVFCNHCISQSSSRCMKA